MPTPTPALPELFAEAQLLSADADHGAVLLFTGRVELDAPADQIRRATLWTTAHGVFEATVNDQPTSDAVLNPGWTAYEWRLQVIEDDVTDLVRGGDNAVEVGLRLGNGWWRGDLGFLGAEANYGDRIGVAAVLEVEHGDGAIQRLSTSPDWTCTTTDTVANSLYNGQTIDARLRHEPATALDVTTLDLDRETLVAQASPPVRRHEVLRPTLSTSPSGAQLLDFGQNLVGWLRVSVDGPAGAEITLRHAEVLEHGELGVRPLRGARATDAFVCSGQPEVFEPTFTFHGFRYAEVSGWPGDLAAAVDYGAIEAVVVHSELERTGWFECSDDQVNQLVSNSIWGQKGNFLSVPTDCPQRDERLGWTGDIAAYAATAAGQFDVADFLGSWLVDLELETRHSGLVPNVVPDALKLVAHKMPFAMKTPTAIWGDASVWVPQALWWAYGNPARLDEQYSGMVQHLEGVEKVLSPTGLWDTGFQFADWLDPDAPPDDPAAAKADKGVVATASLYRSASFTAEAARVLGLDDDAPRWQQFADQTKAAFVEHYVSENGQVLSDCATVYALALHFGLMPDDLVQAAADRLAELVEQADHRVSTGFAGTAFVTWALSEHGHPESAYRLLLERECPSWLYPVTMGATTIWERWDSMLPDGSINPGEMTSFNHYALGAVCDWLYQVVGGIRPGAPGYASVLLAPVPGEGLDWAKAARQTPRGRVECAWRRDGDDIVVDVLVPDDVPAVLRRPGGSQEELGAGAHQRRWTS
ncbi:alpha-L-rhamnosidase [Aestuariimicrobium ganziense]|uniref:alpha-L-rhamnosidase n=1 Tax=Aestuariimicrobium ganziense TaxID=2773677 RepID=UPI001943C758|nr:alpha-L-rhamnosidase [Aestuariimicrobium ganziense]